MNLPRYMPAKGEFFTIIHNIRHPHDHSWHGNCLEARVLDGDFIRVRDHDGISKNHFTIDARDFTFRKLSEEFVSDHIVASGNPHQ